MKSDAFKLLAAVAIAAAGMQTASAKVKTVEKYTTVTESATIVAIDQANKAVTLKGPEGNTMTVTIDPSNVYLANVKIGQQVQATYGVAIKAELRKPTDEEEAEPFVMEASAGTNNNINDPAASMGATIHMVATITAVDKQAGTATLTGPNGRSMTVDVADPKIEKHLKVGKTVIIDYTNRLILKLDPPKAM
jgi:hypothetical protein